MSAFAHHTSSRCEPPDNLAKALRFAKLGVAVFPCRARDVVDGKTGEIIKKAKTPLTKNGFKDASTDEAQIRKWWRQWPDALVGVPTGKKSGFAVLDLDCKNGRDGFATLATLGLDLPFAYAWTTRSGGEHRFYSSPPDTDKIKTQADVFQTLVGRKETGIDVRGDGGYVIAWGELTTETLETLTPWPQEFEAARRRDENEKDARPEHNVARPHYDSFADIENIREALTFISPDDREIWLTVGMALHAALGDKGRQIWDEWAAGCREKFSHKGQATAWRSFHSGRGVTIASLFHLAKLGGYQPKRKWNGGGGYNGAEPHGGGEPTAWADPEPLAEVIEREPYPVAALPDGIREAVEEVAAYMQCPPEVPACSALAVLSLAGQGIANVARDKRLTGPVTVYTLSMLESGERKSGVDKLFSEALHNHQLKAQEAIAPSLKTYHAAKRSWDAKRSGISKAIERAARQAQDCEDLDKKLRDLEAVQPLPPRVPKLIYENLTLEEVTWQLYSNWPSGGIISPEAGIILGGYSMRAENLMANLSILNVLWDGKPHPIDRRHSESYLLDGARLTICIAAQPETIRQFYDKTKGLARGSGFLSRFLTSCPESKAGSRPYTEEPEWTHLDGFNARIAALLRGAPQPDVKTGKIAFITLLLSPAAKAIWIEFYNDAERSMREGGDFADLKDIASKAAENVARLAALFHLYAHGATGEIGAENVERAAAIIEWHLHEAKRFLAFATIPRAQSNAIELDTWLVKYCTKHKKTKFPAAEILQFGPYAIRKGKAKARDEALAELEALSRVRVVTDSQQKAVIINPKLLEKYRGA